MAQSQEAEKIETIVKMNDDEIDALSFKQLKEYRCFFGTLQGYGDVAMGWYPSRQGLKEEFQMIRAKLVQRQRHQDSALDTATEDEKRAEYTKQQLIHIGRAGIESMNRREIGTWKKALGIKATTTEYARQKILEHYRVYSSVKEVEQHGGHGKEIRINPRGSPLLPLTHVPSTSEQDINPPTSHHPLRINTPPPFSPRKEKCVSTHIPGIADSIASILNNAKTNRLKAVGNDLLGKPEYKDMLMPDECKMRWAVNDLLINFMRLNIDEDDDIEMDAFNDPADHAHGFHDQMSEHERSKRHNEKDED
eukprot:89095_1